MHYSQKELSNATEIVHIIMGGFDEYMAEFNKLTARAKNHFEERNWHGIQADTRERLRLYKKKVADLSQLVRNNLVGREQDISFWRTAKHLYSDLARQRYTYEIAETFYNSVCRKVYGHIGAESEWMFVEDEHAYREYSSATPIFHTYPGDQPAIEIFRQILLDYRFHTSFEDFDRDLNYILEAINRNIRIQFVPDRNICVHVLKPVFFRNKGAYIIGRIYIGIMLVPFAIPLLNGPNGIFVDTIILDPDDISIIFSFARSYFMVEVEIPSELVHFLKSLIPLKPYADLYASIGFNKHGKTELYRHFLRHLHTSEDRFIIAPGIKGMVMSVFTLPSYNIVFKLIKDKFDPPKTTSKAHVKSKYQLVKLHDRVGRMADTHEFENFELPKDRFTPELLEELQKVATSIVKVTENKVIIKHLYTERKMIPLNIFLQQAEEQEIEEVIGEYGNCIKQLAAANIFPGDMLLKNFGVTRHNRVIFYDYDEIGFLTDYRFRRLPEPEEGDQYSSGAWFAVGENDVFPEEFKHFLIGREDIREVFFRIHGEIFEPRFWIEMQKKQRRGEIVDVYPYRKKKRFRPSVTT